MGDVGGHSLSSQLLWIASRALCAAAKMETGSRWMGRRVTTFPSLVFSTWRRGQDGIAASVSSTKVN
jgi:hypothetical protein